MREETVESDEDLIMQRKNSFVFSDCGEVDEETQQES